MINKKHRELEREMKVRETVGDEVKRVSWMKARDGWR